MMQTMPTMPQVAQSDMPATPAGTGTAPTAPKGEGFGQVLQQTHQQAQDVATATGAQAETAAAEMPTMTQEATGAETTAVAGDILAELDALLTPENLQQAKKAIVENGRSLNEESILPGTQEGVDTETLAAASALMGGTAQPVAQTVQHLVNSLPDDLEGLEIAAKEAMQSLRGQLRQANAEIPAQTTETQAAVKGETGFAGLVQQVTEEVSQPMVQQAQQAVVPGQVKPEIDQRFARLLNPKAQAGQEAASQVSLRQQQTDGTMTTEVMPSVEAPELAVQAKAEVTAFAESLARPVDPTGITLQNMQGSQTSAAVPFQGQPVVQTMEAGPVVQLPSGQHVAETVVVDQVVAQLRGSADGETGQMVLRLKPAELGELRLDLMVESDKVKASIQAQSQQVQEVIERHLPRLRDALEQQGLRVDDFEVTVDDGQDDGRQHAFGQEQQSGQKGYQAQSHADTMNAWDEVPLSVINPSVHTAGGLSLHV